MTIITNIHKAEAQKKQQELVEALGTENKPNQWMVFMETVEKHLPLMMNAGRPTKDEIDNCIIGQLGFTSWREMIESPTSEGGLDWSYNSWKAWLKAWNVVKEATYLRNEQLTASAVNKLKKELGDVPDNEDSYQEAVLALQKEKEEEAANAVPALKQRVKELEHELIIKGAENDALENLNRELALELAQVKLDLRQALAKHKQTVFGKITGWFSRNKK